MWNCNKLYGRILFGCCLYLYIVGIVIINNWIEKEFKKCRSKDK